MGCHAVYGWDLSVRVLFVSVRAGVRLGRIALREHDVRVCILCTMGNHSEAASSSSDTRTPNLSFFSSHLRFTHIHKSLGLARVEANP